MFQIRRDRALKYANLEKSNINDMIPRERVLKVSDHKPLSHDQKTMRDLRVPGEQTNLYASQFKPVQVYKKIDSKVHSLRQGVPYVPLIIGVNERVGTNEFNNEYPTLGQAIDQKQDLNSGFKIPHNSPLDLAYSRAEALKSAKKFSVSTKDQYERWVSSGILADKVFQADRKKNGNKEVYFDKLKHTSNIAKNGIINMNSEQMQRHILQTVTDLKKEQMKPQG
jgi:hypothetical protein